PFNTRTNRAPELIFVPKDANEIVDIFREARKYNKLVAARGGGHSYAAYGLGGKNGAWVIDLQRFDKVDIAIHGEYAIVGAGNRLGRVALQLYDRAKKAIPHGLCPRVGIAGHALHGGFGFSSRNWGLALDVIEAVHVVLPDGRKIWAGPQVEPDLFWCLLGAGSSYGIVTEFKVRLENAPETCVHYWYTWHPDGERALPSKDTLIKVHHEFQEFANSTGGDAVPKELAVRMRILRDYMEITGAYWGPREDFDKAIQPLLKRWEDAGVPPDDQSIWHRNGAPSSATHVRTWREMLLYLANDDHLQPLERLGTSLATSLCIKNKIQSQKLFDYIDRFRKGNTDPQEPKGYFWFLLMDFYGGENSMITNGRNKDNSCYSNREDMFTFQFYINVDKKYPHNDRPTWTDAITWLHSMRDQVIKNTDPAFKVYMCYVDPEDRQPGSEKPIPASYYYGPREYSRLLELKEKYDKKYMLWNPQCIGAELCPTLFAEQ
ncbi:hypothetical protein EV426DRAFT_536288, partial [Tirmania nivea]